ncbi:MAG TPA: hypothetical protein DEA47_04180, partial [Peptococcaceae bacterium]|nr:hypothetical protein [Peptococcaceae bacterium]
MPAGSSKVLGNFKKDLFASQKACGKRPAQGEMGGYNKEEGPTMQYEIFKNALEAKEIVMKL